jgi:glutathione S-transferase
MTTSQITLYAFPVSHFAEKIRWLFDSSGIAYQEVAWIPIFHIPSALIKSGKRTVPFIEAEQDGKRVIVHDSTEIIHWTAKHYAPLSLMPEDPQLRAQAMAIEDLIDSVGEDVIRYMYAKLTQHDDDFVDIWAWGSTPSQKQKLKTALVWIRPLLGFWVGFSDNQQKAGKQRLHDVFRKLDELLADGRSFLVGDQLTIADVSAASILAPIFAPPRHALYSSDSFLRSLESEKLEFEQHPSFRWLQTTYNEHR